MTKTVTSLFHSERRAAMAASRLEKAGIPRDRIDIWSTSINLAPVLEDAGVSRTDAHAYVEGVLSGSSVMIVSCDDGEVDEVVHILDDEGVMDRDEQQASLRPEQSGDAGPVETLAGNLETSRAGADFTAADQPHEVRHGRARIQPLRDNGRPAQE